MEAKRKDCILVDVKGILLLRAFKWIAGLLEFQVKKFNIKLQLIKNNTKNVGSCISYILVSSLSFVINAVMVTRGITITGNIISCLLEYSWSEQKRLIWSTALRQISDSAFSSLKCN